MSNPAQPIRTAIIGYGLSAKIFHIPFLLALPNHFTLTAIHQRPSSSSSNPSAFQDHPTVKIHPDLSTLLADPSIDLVIITTPPSTHVPFCKAALDAGKHILCEKPFTPTSSEAKELADHARRVGRSLAVYQNRRWDADFQTLKELVGRGEFGRVVEVETHFDRHRPEAPAPEAVTWKAKPGPGAGAVYDLGTHLIDQLVVLFGVPVRVTGFIGNQRLYETEGTGGEAGGDSFTVLLHYKNGLICTAKASVVSAETEQLRFWVRGTRASFKKFNLDVQEGQLRNGRRPGDEGFGVEDEEAWGTLTLAEKRTGKVEARKIGGGEVATYVGFYEALAEAIGGKGDNPVTADEAGIVIRLIELAKKSSEEGRTVDVDVGVSA